MKLQSGLFASKADYVSLKVFRRFVWAHTQRVPPLRLRRFIDIRTECIFSLLTYSFFVD